MSIARIAVKACMYGRGLNSWLLSIHTCDCLHLSQRIEEQLECPSLQADKREAPGTSDCNKDTCHASPLAPAVALRCCMLYLHSTILASYLLIADVSQNILKGPMLQIYERSRNFSPPGLSSVVSSYPCTRSMPLDSHPQQRADFETSRLEHALKPPGNYL
jgi:hypothetical protein